jgi:hypothetical protein
MKKLVVILTIVGLFLFSCKKEDYANNENKKDTIGHVWTGDGKIKPHTH